MIITCNKCQTSFKIPSESVSANGRLVRCSKCYHEWVAVMSDSSKPKTQLPSESKKVILKDLMNNLKGINNKEKPAADVDNSSHGNLFFHISIALSTISMVVSIFILSILFRLPIIEAYPKAENLFEKLAIYSNHNLVFDKIQLRPKEIKDLINAADFSEFTLSIPIKNIGDKPQQLQALRIGVYDQNMECIMVHTLNINMIISPQHGEMVIEKDYKLPKAAKYAILEIGNKIDFLLYNMPASKALKVTKI